jgi:hypothetical protein
MIATKLTALLVAAGLVAMAGTGAGLVPVYAQEIENEAEAENEDNDFVVQGNQANIGQASSIVCESEAEVEDNDFIGVTGANTAVSANDCDNTQTAAAVQSNTNTDNDVQVASADSCQQVAALVGFNVC